MPFSHASTWLKFRKSNTLSPSKWSQELTLLYFSLVSTSLSQNMEKQHQTVEKKLKMQNVMLCYSTCPFKYIWIIQKDAGKNFFTLLGDHF